MDFHSKINKTIETPLSRAFFSKENINEIQVDIIDAIKEETKINITHQDESQLLTLMRNVLNTEGESGTSIFHESMPVEHKMVRLNRKVIRSAVENIKKGITSYLKYVRDASSLLVPIPRAQLSTKDNSMELTTRFF